MADHPLSRSSTKFVIGLSVPFPSGHALSKSPALWGRAIARLIGPGGRGLGSDGSLVALRPASRMARSDRLSNGAATVAHSTIARVLFHRRQAL